jgi:hypothetical protein
MSYEFNLTQNSLLPPVETRNFPSLQLKTQNSKLKTQNS